MKKGASWTYDTPSFLLEYLLLYLQEYLPEKHLYPRLHQCFFLGASWTSPNFCFSIRR